MNNTDPRQYWKLVKHFMKSNIGAEIIPPLKTTSDTGEKVLFFHLSSESECIERPFCVFVNT